MKKFTKEYSEMIRENLEDTLKDKLSEQHISLKKGIIDLMDESIDDTSELVNVQKFIDDYIKDPEPGKLQDFIENVDIFNFYLKYQGDIDDICNNTNWFDESPKDRNIFSLYDIIVEGTKYGVVECLKEIQSELFA